MIAAVDFTEEAMSFSCGDDHLVGVLSVPREPAETAVAIIVGGPQYRAGSHRQFVGLARGLACAGHVAMRFDYRGMGDSTGKPRDFESVSQDIGCALDVLQSMKPQVKRFVLWGLCDGASAALLYVHDRVDPRIAGLVLANPWVRSGSSLARTHIKHYYLQRLVERDFWIKLVRGHVGLRALKGLARNAAVAAGYLPAPSTGDLKSHSSLNPTRNGAYPTCMADGLRAFSGHTLILLSENDYTAKEFIEFASLSVDWRLLLSDASTTQSTLADADHTFSGMGDEERALSTTLEWLSRTLDA